MNLFGVTQNYKSNGGYLTPRLNYKQDMNATALTPTEMFRVQTAVGEDQTKDHWAVGLTKYTLAAPADVVDTLGSLIPGVKRGSLNDAFYESIGQPGFAQWVRDNHGGVEVASGILGAVVTGWAAEAAAAKLVGSAWFAATGVGKATAPVVNWYANAQRTATQASLAAAKSGKALGWYAGDGTAAGWLMGTNRAAVNAAVARGMGRAAVSELAIAAALHNNTAVWSDDMSTNALFAGLGLGIGGLLGGIAARGAMLKEFNSEAFREITGRAMDPGGYVKALAETPMTGLMKKVEAGVIPARTAEFTSFMLNARRVDSTVEGKVVSRPQVQTQSEAAAMEVLQTITNRGTEGVPLSGFTYKGTGEGQHVMEAAHQDPTILFGASSLSRLPEGSNMEMLLNRRKAYIEGIKEKGTPDQIAHVKELEQETPLVLVNKEWMPAKAAEDFLSYNPIQTKLQTTANAAKELVLELPYSTKKVFFREDGGINAATGNVHFESLHTHDQLAIIQASNQMLAKLTPADRLVVQKNPSFFQLDFAIEAKKRGVNVDFRNAGYADVEEAKIASLQKKAEIALNKKELGTKERFALNLPQPSSMERVVDPEGLGLKQILKQASQPGITIKDLADIRVKAMNVIDLAMDTKVADAIDGDVFNFGFTRKGKKDAGHWLNPVVGFFRDVPTNHWTRFDLGIMAAERQASTVKTMMTARSPLTRMLARAVASHPDFKAVRNVLGMADNMIGGTRSIVGATASQFLTQAHRFRNNATLLGAQAVRRVVNRMTELHVDEMLKRISPHIDLLSSTGGKASRLMLNNYLSHAGGWEIRSVKALPDGKLGFVLEPESEWNMTRLGGRMLREEELLEDANGMPVVLDAAANDARIALEDELHQLLKERNAIRLARGLEPVNFKKFYVPSPNTRGRIVGFTFDAANRVVPGGAIIADTLEQFNSLRSKLVQNLPDGHRFMSQDEVRQFADIWEQAEMDFVNPLDFVDPTTLAARSGPQQGKLLSAFINPRAFEDTIMHLKKGYEQVANGVIRNTFDPQLKVARIRDVAMKQAMGVNAGAKSIFETFEETLMGVPAHVNPKGVVGVAMKGDELIDKTFQTVWPHANVSVNHFRNLLDMVGHGFDRKKLRTVKDFDDLADALGPYMPFKAVTDYAEYKYGLKAPWKSKEIARHVNRLASGIVLRWLEVPHAMMNVAGIITNMPSIVFAKNVPSIGRVANVQVPDAMRIMARGLKRSFGSIGGQVDADTAYMIRNGDTSQDVAEIHAQMSLLRGKSGFERFLTGDPKSDRWWKKKGVEGVASVITDTSENWGRRLSHYIGLELADLNGIRGMEARHNFARQIANDAIANYDPLNRPEIFQSAFGSMYGLFLSYAQNYYQRLFRWMEEGDYRSVGSSLAIQGSMFGFLGIPGVRQLANLVGGEEEGDGLVDGIYKRFGPAVGSIVAQGGFNQWTSLFSLGFLPPMALHTRGDASFRHPALEAAFGMGALPVGLEVLKDISTGMWEAGASLVNPDIPNSGRYAAEILARQLPSRALRGTLSVMALQGQEADAYGNLMSETKDWMESAYRILGVRSGRQQSEIEMYFMNQKSLAIDAEKMDKVRTSTRALIRDGNYDRLPQVFESYLNAGGKPWNYRNWIKGMIKESGETRGQNQLLKMLRRPEMQHLARRLEWAEEAY